VRHTALIVVATLAALAPPAAAAARIDQLVVFRDGRTRQSHPGTSQTTVKLHARRCTVGASTPLAALIHSGVGRLSLRDYGSCSKRASDAGGLFVAAIGSDRNRGSDGWVYKAGNVLGTAGAADPGGPFGHGRLRAGARVTWFWCHVSAANDGCPHTLGLSASASGGVITLRVRDYNDAGEAHADSGATVHVVHTTRGDVVQSATTGGDGVAHLSPGRGTYFAWATKAGRITSFKVKVSVK
jgi:hypothetical protein